MKRKLFITFAAALGLLSGLLITWNLDQGSLHNSDDSLYADISRQVANGHVYPLQYSENQFDAKPPLYFWLTGFFVHLFGDQEWTYRLPATLSFVWLLIIAFRMLWTRVSPVSAYLGVLLLLGSPMLFAFSRRVMIDMPIAAIALTIIFLAERRKWNWVFLVTLLGMGFKGLAILPTAAAALAFIRHSDFNQREKFGAGVMLALSLGGFIFYLSSRPRQTSAGIEAAASNVLEYSTNKWIYWDILQTDTVFLWGLPVALVVVALQKHFRSRLYSLLFLSIAANLLAVFLVRTTLPHYLIPSMVLSLVLIAGLLSQLPLPKARALFLVLAIAQIPISTRFVFNEKNPKLDPAHATKKLALSWKRRFPAHQPICAVNVYPAGFQFYAHRKALGIFTNPKAFRAHDRIPEFRNMVFETTVKELPTVLREKCEGQAIIPSKMLKTLPSGKKKPVVVDPLALIQFL